MHSGWGVVVAVSSDGGLEVIDRRHILVAEASTPGSKQPYHYSENLGLKKAEEHIARCSAASGQLASAAIREILAKLESGGHRVEESAILTASGRTLPSLEKILASHALIHTAEGELFRNVVHNACEEAGLVVTHVPERDLEERAQKIFGHKANQVRQSITALGKRLGPPWTRDEKLAALAATLALQPSGPR